MKTLALLRSDIRFQFRYGFYAIYLVFTLVYIAILYVLPETWRTNAALLLIFTDPAAMGLFFMGAIVLYEKNERVLNSIAISPVSPLQYVVSKLVSIAVISTVAALVIGGAAGIIHHPLFFTISVFLCSCLFSALGLIAACKIQTLNQFFLFTVPIEVLTVVPAVLWMFWLPYDVLLLHPSVAMLMLCSTQTPAFFALLSLFVWTGFFGWIAVCTVTKMFQSVGGIKL